MPKNTLTFTSIDTPKFNSSIIYKLNNNYCNYTKESEIYLSSEPLIIFELVNDKHVTGPTQNRI